MPDREDGQGGLPRLALSVRQPWAWAIVHAGKDIENRSAGAVRAGGMRPGRICVHAAAGMTAREYRWAVWRMGRMGIAVPRPDTLPRGAVVGAVTVVGIVERSDSPWFGGPLGLVLRNPAPVEPPVPASGALGYFTWSPSAAAAAPSPWMVRFGESSAEGALFADLPAAFASPPAKPARFSTRRGR